VVRRLQETYAAEAEMDIHALKITALENGNVFERIMEAAKVCSLGQITEALFEVGGQYRRNM